MANFTFTSNSNSVLVDIDGKQAPFGDKELHPYTYDRSSNDVFLYDSTGVLKNMGRPGTSQKNNRSKDRIPISLGLDTVNVDGTTSFADAGALLDALRAIFFLTSGGGSGQGWDGVVSDRNALPTSDPPTVGSVYLAENPVLVLGIYKQHNSGLYIRQTSTGALSDWRPLNVKSRFTTSEFRVLDATDQTKQIAIANAGQTTGTTRTWTAQDKDIVVADGNITVQGQNSISGGGNLLADRLLQLVNDILSPAASSVYGVDPSNVKGWHQLTELVTNNAGQIKLNWLVGNRPESPSGFTGGVPQNIILNTNYTVSSSPTTTYPFLANDLIGGQNVIDNGTLFLRELLAGQTIIFRVKVGYLNKGAGQNGNVIVRMFNPNPGSSFVVPKSIPTPDGTNAYEEEFEFIAIADSLSLDPLYGYAFEAETTFSDGNLIVYIQEITAFYLGKDLFNKT